MYDLVIVGGGPAGLTAAIYAIRKRLNALVLSNDLGGKTKAHLRLPWLDEIHSTGFDAIRGVEVVNKFCSEVEYLKEMHRKADVKKIGRTSKGFLISADGAGDVEARAVIVATGARQERLQVPGAADYWMRGLAYSALSYAPLFVDRTVALIGDGDLALRSAAELAIVAKKVYFICDCNVMFASPLGDKLRNSPNVELMTSHVPVAFKGNEFLDAVIVKDRDGITTELSVDGAFVERQVIPNSEMVKGLAELDLQGHIRIDCGARTNVPGLFAAGDVTNLYAEQVLIAVGEGAKAALSAYDYLLPML